MTVHVMAAVLAVSGGLVGAPAQTPDDVTGKAFDLRMAGQAGQAKQMLLAALGKNPDNASAQFELARTCLYLMDLDRAQTAIEQAVRLRPDDARYHYWAGLVATYNAVLKYKNPKTRGQVGTQMSKALSAYSKAVALRPDDHEARFQLANAYLRNPADCGGSRSKAEQQAKALEDADAVYGARARCLLLGYREVGPRRALWEKVVAKHPERADAHEGMARACMGTDKGLQHLDKALELDPTRSELLVDLTRHYAMAKQYAKAERTIQRYLAFTPSPPVPMRAYATFCAAKIHKMQRHDARANALLAEAKKLDAHCWMFFRQPPHRLFTKP